MFTPVESMKFLKRRKIVTFIGCVSYLLLAVYYIVRAIVVSIYRDYFQHIDYQTNAIALIIFGIISLVFAFCLFMIYKRTKHIDLNEN